MGNHSHFWSLHYGSFVGYEPEKVVNEPKLKVFVVPFSHVDPGEKPMIKRPTAAKNFSPFQVG